MQIALAGLGFITNDLEYNKKKIIDTIEKYSGRADLILFGESFLQGFECLTWDYDKDIEIALEVDSPVIKEIRETARKYKTGVSFGFIEGDGEVIYSSQISLGDDSEIINLFRRLSTGWKEPKVFSNDRYAEGEDFPLFEYKGIKISVGLCGDLWYDENISRLTDLKADLILWPVYTDFNYKVWNDEEKYEYGKQVSALKKVAYVNSYCSDEGIETDEIAKGGAVLFDNGKIVDEIPSGKEGVLLVTI